MDTLLSISVVLNATFIVAIWIQNATKRNLDRYNQRLLKDSQNYRGLYEHALKNLQQEEKDNDHLRYVLNLQEVLIDELNSTIYVNNMDVVDPETVTVCK